MSKKKLLIGGAIIAAIVGYFLFSEPEPPTCDDPQAMANAKELIYDYMSGGIQNNEFVKDFLKIIDRLYALQPFELKSDDKERVCEYIFVRKNVNSLEDLNISKSRVPLWAVEYGIRSDYGSSRQFSYRVTFSKPNDKGQYLIQVKPER